MKLFAFYFYIVILIVFIACDPMEDDSPPQNGNDVALESKNKPVKYADTITAEELKKHLYTFAADDMQGRVFTSNTKAGDYLVDYYKKQKIGIAPSLKGYKQGEGSIVENILAYIEGTDKKDEVIVISAHYDHIGTSDKTFWKACEAIGSNKVCNGADDNGSGTVALMEIAQAFQQAKLAGFGPRRSILLAHFDAEEIGLWGSLTYIQEPVVPLANTMVNLNMDMIGRRNQKYQGKNIDYIYLIGADRHSKDLHNISEQVNQKYSKLTLDYTFNRKDDPNRYYERSDQYHFARKGIPAIFYSGGSHEDYHKASDTADKIDYRLLQKRVRLVFYTAWELANRDHKLRLN